MMNTVICYLLGFLLGVGMVSYAIKDLYSECEKINKVSACVMQFAPVEDVSK